MSTHGDSRRTIAAWLEAEAADRAPMRLIEASRARIRTTPQRRAWWLAGRGSNVNLFARLGVTAVAVTAVGVVGLTLMQRPATGPAASPSPTASASVTPSPDPGSEAEQIIAQGTLVTFAGTGSGTLLTVWETCERQFETDCGHAWRLGTGSQAQAMGMVGRGDVHVDVYPSGDGFLLTPPRGRAAGLLIARDGTASPRSMGCSDVAWSVPTEPGRLAWTAGLSYVDTVAGAICPTSRLGGRPLAQGAFTANGTLWALVDNETGPDTLTIGRFDGVEWRYHDFAAQSGSWTSVIAAAGSTVVVLLANPEPSPRGDRLVGFAVTTDDGATWSEVLDPEVLKRDLPFSTFVSSNLEDWFSGYTSMAFAGGSTLYIADGRGDLWRSTDFATFSRVSVAGAVRDVTPAGDAVIARIDNGGTCGFPAACQINDLVRISADGSVEPLTVR